MGLVFESEFLDSIENYEIKEFNLKFFHVFSLLKLISRFCFDRFLTVITEFIHRITAFFP